MQLKTIMIAVLCSIVVSQVNAQRLIPFRLPDAAQTISYTTTAGEDADYVINPVSWTNNGDGTITDNITGLMWQKTDAGEMTWENAGTYCNNLVLAGYSDWRLPTGRELFSINHFDHLNPAMDTTFFTKTAAQYWWSSEQQVNDPTKIWVVNSGGGIGPHPKTETISAGGTKRFHVRAVRDPYTTTFSVTHLTDNGDGTINDNQTGLMWQKVSPSTKMSWEDALVYANNFSIAGYSDWRLPDVKELQSINDITLSNPSVSPVLFTGINTGNFWSSTSLYLTPAKAWDMNTSLGIVTQRDKTSTDNVLLVRGGFDNTYLNINEAVIPGGEFAMGDHFGFVSPGHPSDEIPIHNVKVDSFRITTNLTTNRQFLAFLNSYKQQGLLTITNNVVRLTGDTNTLCYTSQYASWYSISYDGKVFSIADFRNNHPVVGVRWIGAAAFCNWLSVQNGLDICYTPVTWSCDFTKNGYRLPTEAEWEYAGRGGHVNPCYNYPTGNTLALTQANLPSSGDPYETGSYPLTTPVGFYDGTLKLKTNFNWPGSASSYQTTNGANDYGLYDMAGNVWEFVNDWYGTDYYSGSVYSNPTGPSSGSLMPDGKPYRGMRGGNWYNGDLVNGIDDGHSRVSNRDPSYYRGPQDPNHPWYHVGFRVARKYIGSGMTVEDPNTMGLIINDTANTFHGYTLFSPKHNTKSYLINNDGRKVHEWTASIYHPGQSAYLLENGNLLRPCQVQGLLGTGGGEGGRVEEYDWNDNLVWSMDYATSTYMQHHDVRQLPNGNILMLVVEKKLISQVIAAGFDTSHFQPDFKQKGFMLPDYVAEIHPTFPSGGTVVWEWHVWDHLIQDFDATKQNYGVVAAHPELIDTDGDHTSLAIFWNHMNSIDYNPALDQIALSVRGNSEVWIIDHSTTTAQAASHSGGVHGKGGDLLYRWGNPVTYGAGTASSQKYFMQHDVEWVHSDCPGAGNLTCFNNGVSLNYSTIDEITPPVDASGNYSLTTGSAFGPSNFTWTYQATPSTSMYSDNISGAFRLPNGNTLIDNGTQGTFIEVTAAGEVVWKYINPVDDSGPMIQGDSIGQDNTHPGELMNAVFRVYRYPTSYPAFEGKELIPGDFIERYPDSLQIILEGLYAGGGLLRGAQDENGEHWPVPIADKITVELHDASNFNTIVYTAANVNLNRNGVAAFLIPAAYRGSYYIAVKHRNSIETVSATPVSLSSGAFSYNFTTAASKAYGNNMVQMADGKWAFYGGDVNQDGIIDGSDFSPVDNKSGLFSMGYLAEDVNGDGLVDGSDMAITDNNAFLFVSVATP